ncbi:MAG: helix-turn-helix transcriptional regulator [Comamonadaceae bacterium]|nr:helix-turn-helix transcriptional regulator [Comamonadaceae bacterium]
MQVRRIPMDHLGEMQSTLPSRLRPFYAADVSGFSAILAGLICPGSLKSQGLQPSLTVQACGLLCGGTAVRISGRDMSVRHDLEELENRPFEVLAVVILEGTGYVEQSGKRLVFKSDDIVYRATNLPSAIHVVGDFDIFILRVSSTRFFGPYESERLNFAPTLVLSDSSTAKLLRTHLQNTLTVLGSSDSARVYYAEQALLAMLSETYFSNLHSSLDTPSGKRWNKILLCIEANYRNPDFSVEHVAEMLGLSKRSVHDVLKAHDTKYSHLLRAKRLSSAALDLQDEKLSHLAVSEIAYRNGFVDASHFSRAFRAQHGYPPGAARAKASA